MVCEREAEIDAFVPEEYWIVGARLAGRRAAGVPRPAAPDRRQEGRGRQRRRQAAAIEQRAPRRAPFKVAAIERKESKQRPSPPFITSRLQQEAARRFGFSVKRTMGIAQGLYEGTEIGDRGQLGLITYMRTDSTRVAAEALDAVRETIAADLRRRQAAGEAERLRLEEGRAGRPRGDPADLPRPAARGASRPTSSPTSSSSTA